MPVHYLLTYGTLRKGGSAEKLLDIKAKWERTVSVPGFLLVDLGRFPGAIKSNKKNSIVCDLFRIRNQDVLKTLDQYEGYSRLREPKYNFYQRETISKSAERPVAWFYTYNDKVPEDSLPIHSGDWLEHIKGKVGHA